MFPVQGFLNSKISLDTTVYFTGHETWNGVLIIDFLNSKVDTIWRGSTVVTSTYKCVPVFKCVCSSK